MHLSIETTPTITYRNGTRVRLWKGVTDDGIPCAVFVAGLAVEEPHDEAKFAALLATDAPVEVRPLPDVLDLRLFL
jgi:hypothetical protein